MINVLRKPDCSLVNGIIIVLSGCVLITSVSEGIIQMFDKCLQRTSLQRQLEI